MEELLHHTTELYNNLQVDLQKIAQDPVSLLNRSEQSYNRAVNALKELKTYINGHIFTSEQEEITFFKEIKPKFLREMIFYLKLLQIESFKPMSSLEDLKAYYQGQIGQIQSYISRNQVLYLYTKLNKNHLDQKMFVREPEQLLVFPYYNVESDNAFSNIYSFKLAKIQASEDLVLELSNMLQSN